MTDPGAPPLNPILQQLEAVLRGIEERTPHAQTCDLRRHRSLPCDCLHAERVRAEQARAVERMLAAAIDPYASDEGMATPEMGDRAEERDEQRKSDAWAAALRAVAPNPGDPT